MSQRRPGDSERFPPLPEEVGAGDSAERPPKRPVRAPRDPSQKARDRVYNIVAGVFALGAVGVVLLVLFLWNNYNSPINPLAPPTPLPIVITATYTPTPTLTPSATLTPSLTYTPSLVPTLTPSLTFTPIFLEGFSTPQGTPPPETEGDFAYTLQRGAVIYLTNPEARGGCRWSSIAGSVMDYAGEAVNGLRVRIVGDGVDETVTTGTSPGFGPGGFELTLGSVARDATYVAQLLDAQGTPISPVYTVVTRSDCAQTIAAVRFVELLPSS